ncbi:beta-1,6-N-acetylglucosaminyltransferase [Sphingobacterium bovistauri]|uniref:Peptide O-xylosyltransferase n=1 Tax=Sphingobacterium bovistauri TaxID=2781959 RepID=A0ABS7Z5G1_9SPHI|nr:beta-1,6-N-acetylglucosaminyltransferase [Sphingobacterium bovistauri]MCA5004120.1 glycosyl transferase [Sphingobacterium bovistauri]
MSSKHAFLIIAHHEFEVLQKLIEAIDDSRNDIYIHFDERVNVLPVLRVKQAKLYVLENRKSIYWGDFSQIEVELLLLRESSNNKTYLYYHILSGVDMVLWGMSRFHDFFVRNSGKEFIGFSTYDYRNEVEKKVQLYHLFPKNFRNDNFMFKIVRSTYIRLQILFRLKRNEGVNFKKGTNWVSITDPFVTYILSETETIDSLYRYTFCADEIYKHTLCWNSSFRENIFNVADEGNGSLRMVKWKNGQIEDWSLDEFEKLINSGKIFARKFVNSDIELVDHILNKIQQEHD